MTNSRFQPPPPTPKSSAAPDQSLSPPPPNAKPKPLRWLIFIALAGGAVFFVATNKSETLQAEATLKLDLKSAPDQVKSGSYQVITMESTGRITRVDARVVPNALIRQGDVIADYETPPLLDEKPSGQRLRSQEASAQVIAAEQQVGISKSKVEEISTQLNVVRQRIQQLEADIKFSPANIRAFDNKIINHRQELKLAEEVTCRLKHTSLFRNELDEKFKNASNRDTLIKQELEGRLKQQCTGEIRNQASCDDVAIIPVAKCKELERQQYQLKAEIEQTRASKEAASRSLQTELNGLRDQYDRLIAARQVAKQEGTAAQNSVASRQPISSILQNQKSAIKQLTFAQTEGIVVTANPQAIVGSVLQKGQVVLEVANPNKLQALIEIPLEDAVLVKRDSPITLKFKGSTLPPIQTHVREFLSPSTSPEQPSRKFIRVVSKTIDLNNMPVKDKLPLSQEDQEQLKQLLKPEVQLEATIGLKEQKPLLQVWVQEMKKLLKIDQNR